MRLADGPTVEVDTYVDAPPERVWEIATDLTRMGEWSSENKGGTWIDGDGPKLGVRFEGRNEHPAIGEWTTTAVVTECDSPRRFTWAIGDPEDAAATWRFELVPEGDGTRLRQHVRLGPGASGLSHAISQRPDKEERIVERRCEEHRRNMTATVEGIKTVAEG